MNLDELQYKLDETILYATSALEKSQFANRLNKYQYWCFFDVYNNPYWAISNLSNNASCFDIHIFRLKDTYDGFEMKNAVAECNCLFQEQDGKQQCYIELLWVKNKDCQGKGLGSIMLNMLQFLSKENNVTDLVGCMKSFTKDSTPSDLREFYIKKGFKLVPHKNGKTASLSKEVSLEDIKKFESKITLLEGYGIPFNAITTPELKTAIQFNMENSPTLTKQKLN